MRDKASMIRHHVRSRSRCEVPSPRPNIGPDIGVNAILSLPGGSSVIAPGSRKPGIAFDIAFVCHCKVAWERIEILT